MPYINITIDTPKTSIEEIEKELDKFLDSFKEAIDGKLAYVSISPLNYIQEMSRLKKEEKDISITCEMFDGD